MILVMIIELGRGRGRSVLDHVFSFLNLKAFPYASEIHAAAVATAFPADAAGAELVRNRGVRFYAEFHGAALAASFEEPGGGR
jgi:hypothetical protein